MYLKQIQEAEKAAGLLVMNHITDDTCPAFSVIYCPKKGTGGTAATATFVQGGNFTFTVDGAAPAGLDSIGTAGVIDTSAAAYNTVGEFVNYVNTKIGWAARALVDPATPMANVLAKSSASCLVDGGLTFYLDTSVADTTYIYNIPLTGNCFFNPSPKGIVWGEDHASRNYINTIQFMQNFTTAATMYIKSWKKGDTAATTQATIAMTDNTLMSYNVTSPTVPLHEAPEGYTLAVEVRSDLMSTAPTVFTVTGKTVIRDGAYAVTSKQY